MPLPYDAARFVDVPVYDLTEAGAISAGPEARPHLPGSRPLTRTDRRR
jgi:hypothetical protein